MKISSTSKTCDETMELRVSLLGWVIDGKTRRMIETCVMPEVKLLKTFLGNFKGNVSEMLLFRGFVFRLKAGYYQ